MNKPLKITLIVLGSIIGFVLLLFVAITLLGGSIAKNYVNNHAQDLIGRQANIEHVGINLFTGHVAVNGLSVMEDDGTTKFAGFDTLDIGVSLLRMLGHTVYVRHITLAGLDVNVEQEGSRFNFSSILDHFASDSTEVEEEQDTTPSAWVISLHNIRLANGSARYTDKQKQSRWGFNDLNLIVPDFALGGSDNTDAGLTLALADGGKLNIDAKYNAESNDFEASLDLDNFALNQVKAYVTDMARVDEIQGRLELKATAKGNVSQIMDMEIEAQAAIDDVDVIDEAKNSVLALQHLAVDVNKVVLSQNLFDINSVTLSGLSAKYETFADSTNTLSRFMKPSNESAVAEPTPADTTQQTAEASKPMQLRVGHVDLSNINVTYADYTMPDKFVFPLTNIRIQADELTTTGNNNARVFASLPSGGAAIIDWSGNLSEWKSNQSLRLNIKNLHLSDLSPYMVAYFGMPFAEGIFSFTSYNTIRNSQLNGQNRVDIYKPTMGEKRKDVKAKLHLPVKAALYILKDKDEKVILDVPIAGNIDNPEFNYMKLVWKTLGNLVVKVATSPFRSLGNMFGGKSDELFINIDPNEDDFTSEQFYQIDKVADLTKSDENYHLNLELQSRPTDDAKIQQNHESRNKVLQHHLTNLGIAPSQFSITAATPSDSIAHEGYMVTLSIKDEE
ncbi:MAG: DUF748 domain-containing protein [Bacteroidales bacterium]|nr:DUF748 domain-containing protein [Bacteroidales bacterium]